MARCHRLPSTFRCTRVSHAIDEEIQFHIAEREEELKAEGSARPMHGAGLPASSATPRCIKNGRLSWIYPEASRSCARPRLNALLVGSFALLALALGGTPEMAVRMALGAAPERVVHEVAAGGLRMCLEGLAGGLAGACGLGRAMGALLYEAQPGDPVIFGVVAGVLLCAALPVSWLPARRIARIDPVVALRQE